MARAFIAAPILLMLAVLAASAQGHVDELRSRLESRFEIVPIANGVVLTPRFRTSVKSIELSDATIAIDGTPVTGAELRERLGNDADLVLQVSYLDAEARRSLAADEDAAAPKAGRSHAAHDRSVGPHGAPKCRARRARGAVKTSFASAAA